MEMVTSNSKHGTLAWMVCAIALSYSIAAIADDLVSFATGGYARGLRSKEMMHKVDTNGDGMVSKDEWLAFQEKVFTMLDKKKTGIVDAKEFVSANGGGEMASFATGGYARGLRTKTMMHKIDADADGTVSHDEFVTYQTKVFDMMDTSTVHKGMVGEQEMFATGGNNKR
jgi:EF hand